MTQRPPDDLSTVQPIERLQQQTTTLVKTEIRDALDEFKSKGSRLGVGANLGGVGSVLLFLGLGTLVAAAIIGLAEAVAAWLSALIIGIALLAIGGVTVAVGARQAKSAVPPTPEHTVRSVQKDVATLKEHL